MPAVRTQLLPDDDPVLQFPFDNKSSPILSPLSPLYPFFSKSDSAAPSPVSLSSTPLSSRRPSTDSGHGTSSDRRVQRNLERDPSWVPRPRNAFIIFRCRYSREHCHSKEGSGPTDPNTDTEKTLSKRAAEAWRQLSPHERDHFKELANLEKEEHARQNPNYRFRPVKRQTPIRRNSRPWMDVNQSGSNASDEMIPDHIRAEDSSSSMGFRRCEARRFSESQPPPAPVQVDRSVKAARRRSSSVPLLGTESGLYQPWLMNMGLEKSEQRRTRSDSEGFFPDIDQPIVPQPMDYHQYMHPTLPSTDGLWHSASSSSLAAAALPPQELPPTWGPIPPALYAPHPSEIPYGQYYPNDVAPWNFGEQLQPETDHGYQFPSRPRPIPPSDNDIRTHTQQPGLIIPEHGMGHYSFEDCPRSGSSSSAPAWMGVPVDASSTSGKPVDEMNALLSDLDFGELFLV